MATTPGVNYPGILQITAGTEIDDWAPEYNSTMVEIDAQIKARANEIAGKAATVHTHAGADITSGTLPGARMPALTGDVTSTVNTVATTIAAAAVTNAKLANMAANTIKGSVAGGVPADLTGAQVLTIAGAASAASVTSAITTEVEVPKTASFTLTAAEAGKMVTFNAASGVTCTVNSSVFAAGNRVDILQLGAGQVTFAGSATRRSSGGKTKLSGQYSGATIWFISATEYVLFGDIAL